MNNGKVTFKQYTMNQASLLPPSPGRIDPGRPPGTCGDPDGGSHWHQPPTMKYKGGETSSYYLRMMLKVLVYAYTEKTYS